MITFVAQMHLIYCCFEEATMSYGFEKYVNQAHK